MKLPPRWPIIITPYALLGIGVFLNFLVVTANGGVMPVHAPKIELDILLGMGFGPGDLIDPIHALSSRADHLKVLTDWIQIPDGTCSVGDLCIWLGRWLRPYAWGAWVGALICERKYVHEIRNT